MRRQLGSKISPAEGGCVNVWSGYRSKAADSDIMQPPLFWGQMQKIVTSQECWLSVWYLCLFPFPLTFFDAPYYLIMTGEHVSILLRSRVSCAQYDLRFGLLMSVIHFHNAVMAKYSFLMLHLFFTGLWNFSLLFDLQCYQKLLMFFGKWMRALDLQLVLQTFASHCGAFFFYCFFWLFCSLLSEWVFLFTVFQYNWSLSDLVISAQILHGKVGGLR